MTTELLEQHRKHKERQLRIKAAAAKLAPPPPPPAVEEPPAPPEPEKKFIEVPMPKLGVGPTLDIVLQEVCDYYKVELMNVLSNRRINNIVIPRQMVSYMVYKLTKFTTVQVAKKLDRDPTTIGYAIHKIEGELEKHQEAVEELSKRITERISQRKTVFVA